MKKIILFFLLFFCSKTAFANIDYTCFEKYGTIEGVGNETIKILTYNENNYYFQDDELLNHKLLNQNIEKKYFDFIIDGKKTSTYKVDFDQYDKNKNLILYFPEKLIKNSFNYTLSTNNYNYYFEISKDGKDWSKIEDNLKNYDIDYLKITFDNKNLKNTSIYNLSFYKKEYKNEILINSLSDSNIFAYNTYVCDNNDLQKLIIKNKKTEYFPISVNTKTYKLDFSSNPSFDSGNILDYRIKDIDQDGVVDINDNCLNIFNPVQLDSNANGKGDVCSDIDNDGIIGYLDNCPYISNNNQKDINNNGVGDACEFDKDEDGVFDSIDNCINSYNPEQKDSDEDGIGDSCDNCEKFNPAQTDKNNNNIGDSCEIKSNLKKDSDDDGIPDSEDNCIKTYNPEQKDSDEDGIGDSCDNCREIKNTNQTDKDINGVGDICEDFDQDGLVGYLDNCPYISNNNQEDSNNNGVGNSCEDNDNDGILNANDNCVNVFNPKQKDLDNDGIGNSCDEKDDRFIESNKTFFIFIIIFIVILFLIGIYSMITKIRQIKK